MLELNCALIGVSSLGESILQPQVQALANLFGHLTGLKSVTTFGSLLPPSRQDSPEPFFAPGSPILDLGHLKHMLV